MLVLSIVCSTLSSSTLKLFVDFSEGTSALNIKHVQKWHWALNHPWSLTLLGTFIPDSSGRNNPAAQKAKPLSFFFRQFIPSSALRTQHRQHQRQLPPITQENLSKPTWQILCPLTPATAQSDILWYSYHKIQSWSVQKSPGISCSGT